MSTTIKWWPVYYYLVWWPHYGMTKGVRTFIYCCFAQSYTFLFQERKSLPELRQEARPEFDCHKGTHQFLLGQCYILPPPLKDYINNFLCLLLNYCLFGHIGCLHFNSGFCVITKGRFIIW